MERLVELRARCQRQTSSIVTPMKIRALVDNTRGKKDRDIEGEVVKKDDDDG
jgi:hypothetical protein